MSLPATENFTGVAAALSGSWTQQLTDTVNKNGSGVGVGSASSGEPAAFWNADVFSADQYSQFKVISGLASGSSYAEVLVFESKPAMDRFKRNEFTFAAQASAVALKSGASADAKFDHGVAVFTMANGGAAAAPAAEPAK